MDFSEDSDAELMGYVAMAADDPETAKKAFAEFYRRHYEWLFKTECRRRVSGIADPVDVVQETFLAAYEGADTYQGDGIADPDKLRRRSRRWLGKIANNVVADIARGKSIQYCVPLHEVGDVAQVENGPPSAEEEIVREELEKLSEKEQDVLREWAYNYKADAKQQRLSNAESSALAKRWGTTPTNIRAIRNRAFERLERGLQARRSNGGSENR